MPRSGADWPRLFPRPPSPKQRGRRHPPQPGRDSRGRSHLRSPAAAPARPSGPGAAAGPLLPVRLRFGDLPARTRPPPPYSSTTRCLPSGAAQKPLSEGAAPTPWCPQFRGPAGHGPQARSAFPEHEPLPNAIPRPPRTLRATSVFITKRKPAELAALEQHARGSRPLPSGCPAASASHARISNSSSWPRAHGSPLLSPGAPICG